MSTAPTPRAWEQDEFWHEAVNILTGGKKLRSEHYLDKLTASELGQLLVALSSSGTFAEQQPLCPLRRGGARDGEPPSIKTLCEISQALRQVWMLNGLERNRLVTAAAQKRCATLGLDAQLTDAVCQVVGEEALVQAAQNRVGDFSVKAAVVLMARQEGKLKAQAEQRKEKEFGLKEQALALDREKFQRETCDLFLKWVNSEKAKAIANSPASHADKLDQLYLAMFGEQRSA